MFILEAAVLSLGLIVMVGTPLLIISVLPWWVSVPLGVYVYFKFKSEPKGSSYVAK